MTFPAYPEYKESGVEWLGKIPASWEIIPLSKIATSSGGLFIDGDWIESKDLSSTGIRYLTSGNVGAGSYKEQGLGYISEEKFTELRCVEVFPNDILISRLNLPIGRSCLVPDLGERIVTCVDNVICRPSAEYERGFLVYLLSSEQHFANMELLGRGATMQRISRSILGNVRFPVPTVGEQKFIASFLDHETKNIDELIHEQEQLIELLNEKRQSIISNAVCRGLDPSVQMKDSGVEWLGMVPEHWQIEKIGSVATIEGGGTPSKDNLEYWNGEIPWVSPKDMKFDAITSTEDCITPLALASSASKLIPEKTVLIVVRSGILKHTIPVAINAVPVTLNQDMKALNFGSVELNEFFFHFVYGMKDGLLHAWSKQGATVESLETNLILKTLFPKPKSDELKSINQFLRSVKFQFQELIDTSRLAITQLEERRSALISAAVTGQIDVRNFQPRT